MKRPATPDLVGKPPAKKGTCEPIISVKRDFTPSTALEASQNLGRRSINKTTDHRSLPARSVPLADLFHAWNSEEGIKKPIIVLPETHSLMGCKPVLGDGGPRPSAPQPSAMDSNAQAIPELWEDRGVAFEVGRYRRFVNQNPVTVRPEEKGAGSGIHASKYQPANDDVPAQVQIDQQDGLVLKLIARKKGRSTGEFKLMPTVYYAPNGVPKDWHNKRAIKHLNDRRREAIDRLTQDLPWTTYERDVLSRIIKADPDGSIWQWTEQYNLCLVGNYRFRIGIERFMDKSEGRTVESVAHEYRTYKVSYDRGETPIDSVEIRKQHLNKTGQDMEVELDIALFRHHLNDEPLISKKVRARVGGKRFQRERKNLGDGDEEKVAAAHAGEKSDPVIKQLKILTAGTAWGSNNGAKVSRTCWSRSSSLSDLTEISDVDALDPARAPPKTPQIEHRSASDIGISRANLDALLIASGKDLAINWTGPRGSCTEEVVQTPVEAGNDDQELDVSHPTSKRTPFHRRAMRQVEIDENYDDE